MAALKTQISSVAYRSDVTERAIPVKLVNALDEQIEPGDVRLLLDTPEQIQCGITTKAEKKRDGVWFNTQGISNGDSLEMIVNIQESNSDHCHSEEEIHICIDHTESDLLHHYSLYVNSSETRK